MHLANEKDLDLQQTFFHTPYTKDHKGSCLLKEHNPLNGNVTPCMHMCQYFISIYINWSYRSMHFATSKGNILICQKGELKVFLKAVLYEK